MNNSDTQTTDNRRSGKEKDTPHFPLPTSHCSERTPHFFTASASDFKKFQARLLRIG